DGNFQTFLPVGGGWVKLSGEADGIPVLAWRFVVVNEGRVTELKDVPVVAASDDLPSSPAWAGDGKELLYLLRHTPVDRKNDAPRTLLRRIRTDGSGDETVHTFTAGTVIAGPVVRGDAAWCKLSDGSIVRIDLKRKAVAETRPAGLSAPDALAVSPDGGTIATLAMDAAGARAVVLLRKDATETLALKAGDLSVQGLDFSPDGGRLVLQLQSPEGKSSLWIYSFASRDLARLVEPGSSPVWHGR